MNIILVEGMDGVGKSTFIGNFLLDGQTAVCSHFSYEDVIKQPDPIIRYAQLFNEMSTNGCTTLILDRGWYSDYVYGLAVRNKEEISMSTIDILEHLAMGYGSLTTFFLTTSVDTAWKRCKRRGEDYIKDKAMLKAVNDVYQKVIKIAKTQSPSTIYEVRT